MPRGFIMALADQKIEYEYIADGKTTLFPFSCKVIYESDLVVLVDKLRVSNFSVSGINTSRGGNIVFHTPPKQGSVVLITRDIPLTREIDYQTNGDFLAQVVNSDFDRLWMALQGVFSWFGRALKYPLGGKEYNAENRQIQNLAEPHNPSDAATKNYVDSGDKKVKEYINEVIDSGVAGAITSLQPGYFFLRVNAEGHLLLTHNDNEPTPPFEIVDGRLVYKIT